FELQCSFHQLRLILVHDNLAIVVEDTNVEHVIHGSHDDQIPALDGDVTDAVQRGHQLQVISVDGVFIQDSFNSSRDILICHISQEFVTNSAQDRRVVKELEEDL